MADFFNGVLDTRNYLCEPIIIIEDRSNDQQNVEAALDDLRARQGVYINLEAVICYDYGANPGILTTSSDDDDFGDGGANAARQANQQFLSDSDGDWDFDN